MSQSKYLKIYILLSLVTSFLIVTILYILFSENLSTQSSIESLPEININNRKSTESNISKNIKENIANQTLSEGRHQKDISRLSAIEKYTPENHVNELKADENIWKPNLGLGIKKSQGAAIFKILDANGKNLQEEHTQAKVKLWRHIRENLWVEDSAQFDTKTSTLECKGFQKSFAFA